MSGLRGETRLDESPWDSQLWLEAVEAAAVPTAPLATWGWAGLGRCAHVIQSESDCCCDYSADLLQLLG